MTTKLSLTKDEMEELRYLLIVAKMKENQKKLYGDKP